MFRLIIVATCCFLLNCGNEQQHQPSHLPPDQQEHNVATDVILPEGADESPEEIREKEGFIIKSAEHPDADKLKKQQWGKPASFEKIDNDLCKYIKAAAVKNIFKTKKNKDCKTVTGENKDARMYLSTFQVYDEIYNLTILFARAPDGNESAIMNDTNDKVNYTKNPKLADPRLKTFGRANGLRVYVNNQLRFDIYTNLINPKPRQEGRAFDAEIIRLANLIVQNLK